MPEEKNAGDVHEKSEGSVRKSSRKRNRGVSPKNPSGCRRVDNCILLCTDPRGTVTRINAYGAEFFGEDVRESLGRKFSEIVLPAKITPDRRKRRLVDHFLNAPAINDSIEFETRHASGRPRRVAWIRSAVHGPKGIIDEILYVGIDVHRDDPGVPASAPLSETEAASPRLGIRPCDSKSDYSLLEKYIDNSKVWAWEMGADARFCYVSPGAENLVGYTPKELIGASMESLLSFKSENGFVRLLEEALHNEPRQFHSEEQYRCKDGKQVWSEITGVVFQDPEGAFAGARGLSRDITQEVAVREELALREQEYRYLFDNTQVALFMVNESGVILNINRTGAKMHERAPEEMIGRKFTEFIPENERDSAFEAFKKNFLYAKSQKSNFVDIETYVTQLDTPKGARYLRLVPKAIKLMDGDQMAAILNTALDTTESCLLQQELKQHQVRLQKLVDERTKKIQTLQKEMLRNDRLTALGRLTSTVSHEIRNPLGTISSSLYVINERLKGNDFGVGAAVERGSRAVRRCDGIIEEMLDFTRSKVLEKRMVDISSWLEKILEKLITPNNVSLVKRIDPGLSAQVDTRRFQRCIHNILENAMGALEGVEGGTIHIVACFGEGRLEIRITDSGPGIPKAQQDKIFDPLYSTKKNGIGMGLPVSKQVMELHGGSISIVSDAGRGTTAILRLPVPFNVDVQDGVRG